MINKKYIQLLIIGLFAFVVSGLSLTAKDIIQLDSKRELFVDYYLIDSLKNTKLLLHEPRDEGPVLYFDNPWEGPFSGYCTIIKDDDNYRLYYRGLPVAGKDGTNTEATCYAESPDGISWRKPNLDLFKINGSFENNVILANSSPASHNFCPFLDTNPNANQNQRYKAVCGNAESKLMGYVSSDRIHWKKLRDEPIITKGWFDSQNVVFWSIHEECYVCYFRTWTGGKNKGFRTVSRATSQDFVHWSEPVEMSFGDTPREHIYTQQTHPYFRAPHIYIAIGGRFMPNKQVLTSEQAEKLNVNPKYYKDCSDAFFMTTRGGSAYDRTFMESFIRPGIGLQNWVSRSNYPALNVVQTGPTEMSLYVNQNYAQPSAHLHRYSLRLDGFSSLQAPYQGGEMITKPFVFKGKNLFLNYATSAAGEIKVEIQNDNGLPVPGFTLEESQPIIGNEIERTVSWQDGESIMQLCGTTIRLRFVMKDADLYSVMFK